MLKENQKQRYSRQIMLEDFGERGQKILLSSKCLVVGVGGLGTAIAMYLSAAGVGEIGLIDNDNVSLSNLQRQILYRESQIGLPKVEAAASNLRELNSDCSFKTYNCLLNEANAKDIIVEYDIVLDATDNYKARYLINDVCRRLKTPFVYSAISETRGQVAFFDFMKGKSDYRNLYPEEEKLKTKDNASKAVMGVLPSITAGFASKEAISYLTNGTASLKDKLLSFDVATNEFLIFDLE